LPVLVVGCIHGNECAGIAVARALERVHANLDLWVIPNLNPDGYAGNLSPAQVPRHVYGVRALGAALASLYG
jgi:murein tripeptide amidase MpaA